MRSDAAIHIALWHCGVKQKAPRRRQKSTRVDRNQQNSTNIARKSTKVGGNRQKSSVVNRSQHFFNGNRSAVQGNARGSSAKTHVLEHKGLWRRCAYFYRQVLIFQKEGMWRLLHQMWHKCAIADSSTFLDSSTV